MAAFRFRKGMATGGRPHTGERESKQKKNSCRDQRKGKTLQRRKKGGEKGTRSIFLGTMPACRRRENRSRGKAEEAMDSGHVDEGRERSETLEK